MGPVEPCSRRAIAAWTGPRRPRRIDGVGEARGERSPRAGASATRCARAVDDGVAALAPLAGTSLGVGYQRRAVGPTEPTPPGARRQRPGQGSDVPVSDALIDRFSVRGAAGSARPFRRPTRTRPRAP